MTCKAAKVLKSLNNPNKLCLSELLHYKIAFKVQTDGRIGAEKWPPIKTYHLKTNKDRNAQRQ